MSRKKKENLKLLWNISLLLLLFLPGWSITKTGSNFAYADPILTKRKNKIENSMRKKKDRGLAYDLADRCDGRCDSAALVYPTLLDDEGVGNVTYYSTKASSAGACNYGGTDIMHYAAININVLPNDFKGQWQGGAVCGQCAEVTTVTSQGRKKVVVRILDSCGGPYCGIDLGGTAPSVVMPDGFGRYNGSWRFVSCEGHPEVSDGEPSLDVFDGSDRWWSRVQVRNGKMAVAAITWQDTISGVTGAFPYATGPQNTWEVPKRQVLQAEMTSILITIKYVDGTTATVTLSSEQLSAGGASYSLN